MKFLLTIFLRKMKINEVILKPVLTEKATSNVKNNVYTFIVNIDANKYQIKEAVEKLYKVKTGVVKVITRKGKIKKAGPRLTKKRLPDQKIALVKLKEGKIDLFPQA